MASAAFAQSQPATTAVSDNSGDIVVTANRQESLLSKTPLAVTALSNEALRSQGISDARGLNNVVPNLRLTDAVPGTGNGVQVNIRGVSSQTTNPSAAFLIDGIYIADSDVLTGAFYDLERVEVLRGPQGTLYGRNTTAGVINVISARPKDHFEASLDGSYGNFNSANVTGMINLPVTGTLGLRAAVNYDRHDSYLLKGSDGPNDFNPMRNMLSGRLSFGGTVGDFSFVVRGDYSRQRGSLANIVPTSNFFPDLDRTAVGVEPDYVDLGARTQRTSPYASPYGNNYDFDTWGVMVDATYDFGPAQLTYLGSHRDFKIDLGQSYYSAANGNIRRAYVHNTSNQESHELRLAFGNNNPLHGQIGGYFFDYKTIVMNQYGIPGTAQFTYFPAPATQRSEAGFGQLTYDITPRLHLTGGLRYTHDKSTLEGHLGNAYPDGRQLIFSDVTGSATSSKFTWKAGVDYDVPNLGLLYATVSTGYKAGGSNNQCVVYTTGCLPANLGSFGPETLTAYEGGFKFHVLNNLLHLNLSGYHYDYKGLQVSQTFTVDGVRQNVTQNAAKASVDGIESEAIITPTRVDTLDLAFNWTDAHYVDYQAVAPTFQTADFSGDPLSQAAKYTARASYTHSFLLPRGDKLDFNVSTQYSSGYYIQDLVILSYFHQPHYTKTDVSLTYKAPGDRWYVEGFGRNLENSITLGSASADASYGFARFETPRTYGVRAGFKF